MTKNAITRVPLLTLVLVLPVVGLGGCYPADQAPDTDAGADAPAVDWTTYAGLHIYAERWKIDTVKNVVVDHDEFGPVDLLEFENAIVSKCYETIRFTDADQYRHICDDVNIDALGPPSPASLCQYRLCRQQLALCSGYANLSLADLVAPTETEVRPLVIEGTPSYDRGRLYLSHTFGQAPGVLGTMQQEADTLRYKVPPQQPADRTLLFEAALEFFRAAGIESGEAFEADCLEPPPAANVYRWTNDLPAGDDAAVSLRVLGLGGFQEATIRFDDVLERLMRNEMEVARLNGADDVGLRQQRLWNGEVNSQVSALRRLYGELDPEKYPEGLLVATTPLDEATERAISVLRASGLDLSDTSMDGRTLASSALQVLDETTAGVMVRSLTARAADAGMDPPDVSALLEAARTNVDDYLSSNGMSTAAFERAARYLREQVAVLEKPVADAATTDSGITVTATYAERAENPPGAVVRARHAPSFARTSASTQLDTEYAWAGAAQAITFFREAAWVAAATSGLTSAEKALLDLVVERADAKIGEITVQTEYFECTLGSCRARFEAAGVDPTYNRALLIKDKAGRQCLLAMTTDLGGRIPCNLRDFIVVEVASPDGPPDTIDQPGGHEGLGFTLESPDRLQVGTELSLFLTRAGSPPELVATDEVKMGEPPTLFGGTAGGTEDAREAAGNRDLDDITESAMNCAGIPRTFVPPLEQELAADSDDYESSWRHYLDLAERLASEADSLGRDMLGRALEMDMRSEAAQAELRTICGDVGPVEPGNPEGSDARACYDDESNPTVTVSLGGPLCYWQRSGVQCLCDAQDYLGDAVHPSICDVPCPLSPTRDQVVVLEDLLGSATPPDPTAQQLADQKCQEISEFRRLGSVIP